MSTERNPAQAEPGKSSPEEPASSTPALGSLDPESTLPESARSESTTTGNPAAGKADESGIDALRQEIDSLDDDLHDLLMRRTVLVQEIGRLKGGGPALRPGREARLLRRLIQRHQGPFPVRAVIAIWREMIAAFSSLQAPLTVGVTQPEGAALDYWELARAQFGAFLSLKPYSTPFQILGALSDGTLAVGIVPLPSEDDPSPWWEALISQGSARPRIIGRLPFSGRGTVGSRGLEALMLSTVLPEETGQDGSYITLEVEADSSRGALVRLLQKQDLEPRFLAYARAAAGGDSLPRRVLVEVAGFVSENDPRLAALQAEPGSPVGAPLALGAYPLPFDPPLS